MMFSFLKRKKAKLFGEIAVEKGLASEKDIAEALAAQKEYVKTHKIHKEIGVFLTEKGILTPNDVKAILEEQRGPTNTMAWFYELFNLSR